MLTRIHAYTTVRARACVVHVLTRTGWLKQQEICFTFCRRCRDGAWIKFIGEVQEQQRQEGKRPSEALVPDRERPQPAHIHQKEHRMHMNADSRQVQYRHAGPSYGLTLMQRRQLLAHKPRGQPAKAPGCAGTARLLGSMPGRSSVRLHSALAAYFMTLQPKKEEEEW